MPGAIFLLFHRRIISHIYKAICVVTILAVAAQLPGRSLAASPADAQGQPQPQLAFDLSDPIDCHLYPIALSAQTLADVNIGVRLPTFSTAHSPATSAG